MKAGTVILLIGILFGVILPWATLAVVSITGVSLLGEFLFWLVLPQMDKQEMDDL